MSNINLMGLKDQGEAPISVYPWVISLLGLQKATLLSVISDSEAPTRELNGQVFYRFTKPELNARLPFWKYSNIRDIISQLVKDGFLVAEREHLVTWYAINVEALIEAHQAREVAA